MHTALSLPEYLSATSPQPLAAGAQPRTGLGSHRCGGVEGHAARAVVGGTVLRHPLERARRKAGAGNL